MVFSSPSLTDVSPNRELNNLETSVTRMTTRQATLGTIAMNHSHDAHGMCR